MTVLADLDFGDDYIYLENDGMEVFVVVHPDAGTTNYEDFVIDFGSYNANGYGLGYSASQIVMYAKDGSGGDTEKYNHNGYAADPVLIRGELDFGSLGYIWVNSGNYLTWFTSDALSVLGSSEINESSTHDSYAGPFTIGLESQTDQLVSDDRYFKGSIAEVIIYDADIDDGDANIIQSYLALKYGLTLKYGLSPAGAGDYISSSGTVIWDASTVQNYINGIGAIGRDDASGLDQRQGQSSSPGSVLAIGLGDIELTNDDNTNSFSSDESFMIWGNYKDMLLLLIPLSIALPTAVCIATG